MNTAEMEQIHPHDADLWRQVADASNGTVLLAFSRGKDSIAAWLALRTIPGLRIVPYHMALIPGMAFEEQSLAYFEATFGCHIHRLAHPSLWRMLANMVFQPPERCAVIESLQLAPPSYSDVTDALIEQLGLPATTLVCNGVRCADSPYRRLAVRRVGPVHKGTAKVVWNWSKRQVMDTISRSGIALPVDYEMFNRSFDGIDHRFLAPLRERFPDDYARVLEWFPLADLELFRKDHCHG